MAKYGKLSSAGKLVYLTMNTRKWPPAQNWAHARELTMTVVVTVP